MDTSSILNESKYSEKYTELDESLRFVQSLVSHRLHKDDKANGHHNDLNGHQQDMQVDGNNEGTNIFTYLGYMFLNKVLILCIDVMSQNSNLNVEDRLMMMNTIYKQRREEKLKQAAEEEKAKTQKSIKATKPKQRNGVKVEDRLLAYGKKKQHKEQIQKSYSEVSKSSTKGGKTTKSKPSEVVNRLMDYGNFYKQKQAERENNLRKTQTFKPNLEKSSQSLNTLPRSQTSSAGINNEPNHFLKYTESNTVESPHTVDHTDNPQIDIHVEDRLYVNSPIKEPTKRMQKIQDEYDRNHTFHPTINSTFAPKGQSEPVHSRLYNKFLTKKVKEEPKPEFKPELNKNSEEIIRLMKEGDDYDKNNRWKSLYNYGVLKQKARKEVEDQIKMIREEEEIQSQPYRPQILEYTTMKEEGPKDVVDRTKEWAASLECKKEVLAESYFQNQMFKELKECTFAPRLVAFEKYPKELSAQDMDVSKATSEFNAQSLENFYRRMQEAHLRKQEIEEIKNRYLVWC